MKGCERIRFGGLHPAARSGRQDADGGFSSREGKPNRSRIYLSLTLIKGVEQSVKNDFTQALGQQGLVGLPHRHLRSQGEAPSC